MNDCKTNNIYFVSSNKFKQMIFNKLFIKLNKKYSIINKSIENLPEIQGTCEEVAVDKAKKAFSILKKPLIIDDENLLIEELNGFPGPYLKDFESLCLCKGMYNVINSCVNKTCFIQVYYALTFDGTNVYTFKGQLKCELIKYRDKKENLQNYLEVLYSNKYKKRLSELEIEDIDDRHPRYKALIKLCEFLKNYDENEY